MKVLIVGLGSIALKHITALRDILPNTEFYALRSTINAEKRDGIINIYDLIEIQKKAIDFAIISNPTSAHSETIKKLIPQEIPLFIEKPLFSELNNEQILFEIEQKKIPTYVACNLRFLDCLLYAKQHIKDKRINEVNIYCGSYLPEWRTGIDYKKSYSANKDLGGGVHIDLIHEIDYAYWLFGKPKNVNKVFSNKSSLEINAYDYANYLLEYSNFNANIILNYFRRDAKRTLEIVLDDKTIVVDILKNKVYSNQKILFNSDKTIIDTYKDQLRFFIEEVVKNKTQFNTVNEAYEILKICLQKD